MLHAAQAAPTTITDRSPSGQAFASRKPMENDMSAQPIETIAPAIAAAKLRKAGAPRIHSIRQELPAGELATASEQVGALERATDKLQAVHRAEVAAVTPFAAAVSRWRDLTAAADRLYEAGADDEDAYEEASEAADHGVPAS